MKAIGRFIVSMFVLAILGCIGVMLFHPSARAQGKEKCLPSVQSNSTASTLFWSANDKGVCVAWICYGASPPDDQSNFYCGTWAEFGKTSPRIVTIQKAKDPLKSLNTLPNRVTVLPLDDPSLAGLPK